MEGQQSKYIRSKKPETFLDPGVSRCRCDDSKYSQMGRLWHLIQQRAAEAQVA